MCRRRGLKVNAGKSKVMLLVREEELECEIFVDGICLEHVSEFTDEADCSKRVANGRRVAGVIRFLVISRSLQLEGILMVLHESFLVPVLGYGSETMIWTEKVKSSIRALQMDNLRSLLGIR